MTDRIVCAANRRKSDGLIVCGARHFDECMRAVMHQLGDQILNQDWEQGFINQRRQFLTRTEAWKVAEAAGQIIHRCGGDETNGGTLYSENLY